MLFYFLIFIVAAIDQVSKYLALQLLPYEDSIPVIPNVFHLTLIHNPGIAFGFFRGHQLPLLAAISLSLVVLFIWGARMKNPPKLQSAALAMILGGALGNWIDRVRYGAVVDFLDFRIWPVFNLADSAITIGVGLYLILLLRASK